MALARWEKINLVYKATAEEKYDYESGEKFNLENSRAGKTPFPRATQKTQKTTRTQIKDIFQKMMESKSR